MKYRISFGISIIFTMLAIVIACCFASNSMASASTSAFSVQPSVTYNSTSFVELSWESNMSTGSYRICTEKSNGTLITLKTLSAHKGKYITTVIPTRYLGKATLHIQYRNTKNKLITDKRIIVSTPSTPSISGVSAGARSITIPTTWCSSSNVKVTVSYSTTSNLKNAKTQVGKAGNNIVITGLNENTRYYYMVTYKHKNDIRTYISGIKNIQTGSIETKNTDISVLGQAILHPTYDAANDDSSASFVRVRYADESMNWATTQWYENADNIVITLNDLALGTKYSYIYEYSKNQEDITHTTQTNTFITKEIEKTVIQEDTYEVTSDTGLTNKVYTNDGIKKIINEKTQESELSLLSSTDAIILSSYYKGHITSIKDQGGWNWCASFSAMAALETAYYNDVCATDKDFSEAALALSTYIESISDGGVFGHKNNTSKSYNIGQCDADVRSTLISGRLGIIDEEQVPFLIDVTDDNYQEMVTNAKNMFGKQENIMVNDIEYIDPYMVAYNYVDDDFDCISHYFVESQLMTWKAAIKRYKGACTLTYRDVNVNRNTFLYVPENQYSASPNHSVQVYGFDNNISRLLFAINNEIRDGINYNDFIDSATSEIIYLSNDVILIPDQFFDENNHLKVNEEEIVSTEPKEGYTRCIAPKGDGGWIIKNSWGEDAGNNGTQYLSYYDMSICNLNCYSVMENSGKSIYGYETCAGYYRYQYDRSAPQSICLTDVQNYGTVYKIDARRKINYISINTNSDTYYTVKVYIGLTDKNIPTSGTLLDTLRIKGNKGIVTASLNTSFISEEDEYVGVTIIGDDGTIPGENSYQEQYTVAFHEGESFIQIGGGFSQATDGWATVNNQTVNWNVCIKLIGDYEKDYDLIFDTARAYQACSPFYVIHYGCSNPRFTDSFINAYGSLFPDGSYIIAQNLWYYFPIETTCANCGSSMTLID